MRVWSSYFRTCLFSGSTRQYSPGAGGPRRNPSSDCRRGRRAPVAVRPTHRVNRQTLQWVRKRPAEAGTPNAVGIDQTERSRANGEAARCLPGLPPVPWRFQAGAPPRISHTFGLGAAFRGSRAGKPTVLSRTGAILARPFLPIVAPPAASSQPRWWRGRVCVTA